MTRTYSIISVGKREKNGKGHAAHTESRGRETKARAERRRRKRRMERVTVYVPE